MHRPREWLAGPGQTLCLSGYPVRIRRDPKPDIPYMLEVDGAAPLAYWAIDMAKIDALRRADEMDAVAAAD